MLTFFPCVGGRAYPQDWGYGADCFFTGCSVDLKDEYEAAVRAQMKAVKGLSSSAGARKKALKGAKVAETESEEEAGVEMVLEGLKEAKGVVQQAKRFMPVSGGMFVEAFFGRNDVRFHNKKERIAFKEEYERFKQHVAPIFLVLCLVCLVFYNAKWLHMVTQSLLAYYYVSLALRENILRANGSNIKPWWIWHHYIALFSAIVLLTWPDSPSYSTIVMKVHLYGAYISLLQIFQTRYQMARVYALRSLGKAGELDVSNSDGPQFHWSESMRFLYPLIIIGQAIQLYVALSFMAAFVNRPSEIQGLLLALGFFAMFLGNFMVTAYILHKRIKRRRDQERKTHVQ